MVSTGVPAMCVALEATTTGAPATTTGSGCCRDTRGVSLSL
jgi:hypothetical protein